MIEFLPRDQIPAGCRWDWNKFIWPPECESLSSDEKTEIIDAVSYYDLIDALHLVVGTTKALAAAQANHDQAAARVLKAYGRSEENCGELPGPPWLIGDHVVEVLYEKGIMVRAITKIEEAP